MPNKYKRKRPKPLKARAERALRRRIAERREAAKR